MVAEIDSDQRRQFSFGLIEIGGLRGGEVDVLGRAGAGDARKHAQPALEQPLRFLAAGEDA